MRLLLRLAAVALHLAAMPTAPRTTAPDALFCTGFGIWKHAFVRAFLRDFRAKVHFVSQPWQARLLGMNRHSALVVWGRREAPGLTALANQLGAVIWRMEDGFLRSVGLGTDFRTPSSLVLDRTGIYFDPRSPSDLENILQRGEFAQDELARAAALRTTIVARALSKYNFRDAASPLERPAGARRVILVPGQVEDDASIRFGTRDVTTNRALLEATRQSAPDAYVMYKPHPDELTGNRRHGALTLDAARRIADAVVVGQPLPACLAVVDEVHTMTSLVGFEGLLRGKRVVCYGQPFYCGWGLTEDRAPVARRTRRLTLDMLVAGTLIRYPRYLRQSDWQLSTPEAIVDELESAMHTGRAAATRGSQLLRRIRMIAAGVRGMFGHGA